MDDLPPHNAGHGIRKYEDIDSNGLVRPGSHRFDGSGIPERCRIASKLQLVFGLIDAPRGINDKHESHVNRLAKGPFRQEK